MKTGDTRPEAGLRPRILPRTRGGALSQRTFVLPASVLPAAREIRAVRNNSLSAALSLSERSASNQRAQYP